MSNSIRLHSLADIVGDLWGMPAAPAKPLQDMPAPPARPEFPPFEQLWKVADETVDWTDALVHPAPADGLTDAETWAMYHKHASAVLSGDVSAYIEVLRHVNPLGDLAHFAAGFDVTAESADQLTVRFQALPAYLPEDSQKCRRYLAGVSLRAARDLFALLPVTQVCVEAMDGEKTLLRVGYEKPELMKVRFAFVDPVEFALQCGGVFAQEDAGRDKADA